MPIGAFSILSSIDTSKLTDAERAEFARLQVEINETVARIQAGHAHITPVEYVDREELARRYPEKSSAWTDEERAEMAAQREADNADAYECGLDGKPIKVCLVPPDAECPLVRAIRMETDLAIERSGGDR